MIFPLTRADVLLLMNDLIEIDKETIGEKWTIENFIFQLDLKWELSCCVELKNKTLGFLIASKKDNAAHIHRVAIDKNSQGLGLGKKLIDELELRARSHSLQAITLKVSTKNKNAIDFYTHIGFKLQNLEGHNFLMMKTF